MRRFVTLVTVLLCIAAVAIGGASLFAPPSTSEVAPVTQDEPDLVVPEDSESGFWTHLNARPAFKERSPINVIVRGDTDEAVRLMKEETDAEWGETDEEHRDAGPRTHSVQAVNESALAEFGTDTAWVEATGATRYAYVDPGDGSGGQWIEESLQLDDGDYYGARYHVRLYESPNAEDEWTVMQAHTEHFDWFTLRHRVDGVAAAQSYVEADFMDRPFVDTVWQTHLDNRNASDSDGWATVIELATIGSVLLVGQLALVDAIDDRMTSTDRRRTEAARERLTPRHLLLAGTIVGLFLGVRVAGIVLERYVGVLSMHAIAALLYPVLAIGIPAATYVIAGGLERRMDSVLTAAAALSVAIWLDYAYLGVASLPIDVVAQRIFVIVALGLIAGGAAGGANRQSRWNDMLLAGSALWILLLIGTLFGYV